jgi:hypothetical protein
MRVLIAPEDHLKQPTPPAQTANQDSRSSMGGRREDARETAKDSAE